MVIPIINLGGLAIIWQILRTRVFNEKWTAKILLNSPRVQSHLVFLLGSAHYLPLNNKPIGDILIC